MPAIYSSRLRRRLSDERALSDIQFKAKGQARVRPLLGVAMATVEVEMILFTTLQE